MQNITSIVEGLRPKIEKLLHLHELVKADNKRLTEANSALQRELQEQKAAVEKLEQQYQVLKLARTVEGDGNKNLELKLKINELVREIDKCIAQLNR